MTFFPANVHSCKASADNYKIVSRTEWVTARKALLQKEKDLTRARDALASELRQLPMVKLDKEYIFHGPGGSTIPLEDLFDGKDQLIVYHFMFGPEAERGCKGCAFVGMFVLFFFSILLSLFFFSPFLSMLPTNSFFHLSSAECCAHKVPCSRTHSRPSPSTVAQHLHGCGFSRSPGKN